MSIRRAQDERIEGTPDGLNAISEIMDVPDTPSIGTATDAGTGTSVSVTFTAAVTGGTPNSYTVTSTPGSLTGTGATSPITVTGLSAGTSYTFKVKAANAAGVFGPESSASGSLTPLFPVLGAYDSLAAVTLSASTSTITFAGIPSGYKHLQIRAMSRSTNALYYSQIFFTINGSTSYFRHLILADGVNNPSAYGYTGQSYASLGYVAGANALSGVFGVAILDILDYANLNKYKTYRGLFGTSNNSQASPDVYLGVVSGTYAGLDAINNITFSPETDSFAANTTFALYGVK